MGSEPIDKNLIVTQISVGGFEDHVTAKMLFDYFEDNIGTVWRCRLKTSSTPFESCPTYDIDGKLAPKISDYERVKPHAFIHFASSEAVQRSLDASGRGELTLGMKSLKVSLGPENPHRLNERSRTVIPFRLPDVRVEIGVLVSRDEFLVAWRGPPTGFDFIGTPLNQLAE